MSPSPKDKESPTTLGNICVCGNRGYSALVNDVHFEDCPCNKPTTEEIKRAEKEGRSVYSWDMSKPTTLREEFYKFCDDNGFNPLRSECVDWWLSKLTFHNTELLRKIEGMKVDNMKYMKDIGRNETLDEVISIINQEK